MSSESMRAVYHDLDLGEAYGHQLVRFPLRQPGATSVVGYFTIADRNYVVKLLRVTELSEIFEAIRPPLYGRLMRCLPLADNPFSPRREAVAVMKARLDVCLAQLTGVDRDQAEAALAGLAPGAAAASRVVVDRLYGRGKESYDLAPRVSEFVDLSFASCAIRRFPALVQDDVGEGGPATAVRVRLSGADASLVLGQFLLLLAMAHRLSTEHRLGLDLVPRLRLAGSPALTFANVLVPATRHRIAYVDYFGLGARDGGVVERAGHHLLYGRWSPVAVFARWLLARYAQVVEAVS